MNRCFPCFGNPNPTGNERDPLLPKHRTRDERLPKSPVKTERSVVDKIIDVLAALNAGKLPTQDQLSHFLQALLKSELFKEDKGKVNAGNGSFSREGRKTLHDIRSLVQAFLQFGMEKNDDDKFQQLYFQLLQIDSESAERGIHAGAHAVQRALEETSEGGGHIEELTSNQKQVAFDAATILHAIRTLYETCLKSPGFRLVLSDILSIAQDVVLHASADVERAARQVQDAAEDVQHQETTDDIINRVGNISVNDAKNKGKEATDKITEAARQATEDLKGELGDLEEKAGDKTKEKILQRMQEVISRIQKDPASRGAMHAVLLLARKYAEMIAAAAERSEDIIIDAAAQVKDDSGSSFPPQPHGTTFDALFDNIKDVLQRLAQGHSLDGTISAFGRIVRNLDTIPQVVECKVERILNEKPPQSPSDTDPPSPLIVEQPGPVPAKKGKGKRKKQARMREQKVLEKQAKLSPAASNSQLTASSRNETSTLQHPEPPRIFFSRLGTYLDKSFDEPGWVMSKDGASALESLFDGGVELFSVFGEAVVDIGEEAVTEGALSLHPSDAPTELNAEEKARRQIMFDLKSLIDEIEGYAAAVKNDQTTMAILHGFDALGDDLSGLFFQSMKQGGHGLSRNVVNMGSWTSWVGWAVPRLLRMLPSDAIPIPTIEVKTENVEAALDALFVQGLARGNTDSVAASLIPDEVVVKQWTEVRIDMAEHEVPYGASTGSSDSDGKPGVQSTSRVRMHMDGVRAKIEGMGYYFKYTGGPIGYEDEGILSIDIGMGGLHEGLSADMEIEIESDNIPFEQVQTPEIVVVDDYSETDTETAVATNLSSTLSTAATEQPAEQSAEPLFRIVDVQVAMNDVRCRIDESRHWILNKLFLEHLAGPMVALMAKQALEERLRAGLGVLSKGLGALLKDARENGELRRAKRRSDTEGGAIVAEGERSEEGLTEKLADWWNAILNTGPMLFGRDKVEVYDEAGDGRIDVEHRTKNTATSRGVIFSSTTVTVEQPRGAPAMVYNTFTKNLEEVNLPVQAIGGVPKVQEDETVVAVGKGPQLFPVKGGAYGASNQSANRGVVDQIRDTAQNVAASTAEGLREGSEQINQVEGRWQKKFDAERRSVKTWKSKAFDFHRPI